MTDGYDRTNKERDPSIIAKHWKDSCPEMPRNAQNGWMPMMEVIEFGVLRRHDRDRYRGMRDEGCNHVMYGHDYFVLE